MIYTIYMERNARPLSGDEEGTSLFDSVNIVPESNAYWALVFPPFWLAYHRLWFALLVYVLVMVLGLALLATPLVLVAMFLGGLPGIYLFLEGNQLRRKKLESKGLDFVAAVDAPDEAFAVERFLSGWKEPIEKAVKTSAPRSLQATTAPSFGMFPQGEI